jgi:nitrate/nitrite-specific signal transduction histidine kinase
MRPSSAPPPAGPPSPSRLPTPTPRACARADALKAGRFGAEVPAGGRDELGQLGRTFNVMIDALRQRERDRPP